MMYAYGWTSERVWQGPLDLSILRALRRDAPAQVAREATAPTMPTERTNSRENATSVHHTRGGSAMMRLPEDERTVLTQRLFEGLSCATIAAQSGRSEAKVREMQRSALEHMRASVLSQAG